MKGFRTILFSIAVTVLGLLEAFDITNFAQFIPDEYEPLVISVVGTVTLILRFLTSTPVGKK